MKQYEGLVVAPGVVGYNRRWFVNTTPFVKICKPQTLCPVEFDMEKSFSRYEVEVIELKWDVGFKYGNSDKEYPLWIPSDKDATWAFEQIMKFYEI